MLGKVPTLRGLGVTQIDRGWLRLLRLGARDIGVELLETELELIRIEPFRATSELAPLQLPNDEP